MSTSISIYPSAHLLADELGHWPSWEEYMASLPSNFRLYPATSRSGYMKRGIVDDSLPIYYHALGPFSYEDEEDGWVEVRWKNYGRSHYGKKSVRGKAVARAKARVEQEASTAPQITRSQFARADEIQFVE